MKVKAPKGYHWMKDGKEYKLMKNPPGGYKPHKGASQSADFKVPTKPNRRLLWVMEWVRISLSQKEKEKSQEKGEEVMPKAKYSAKQKKLARVAPPRDKITGADLKRLRKRGKKKAKSKAKKKGSIPDNVKNKALYSRVKAAAKRKFDVYPSAYANAWLVREYKKRGGTYG